MKYNILYMILPILTGMACASSCSSYPDSYGTDSGEKMEFEAMETPASRTGITSNSNLTEKPFLLFGDVKGAYGTEILFNEKSVKYEGGKWDYGTPLYWLKGQEHSFVAMHPASIQGISDLTYGDSKVSFTYTIPMKDDKIDIEAITDILVAGHRRKHNFDTPGAVKLNFTHILSRINIAPALNMATKDSGQSTEELNSADKDAYIEFKSIKIKGLKTKAAFSFTPASLQAGKYQTDELVDSSESADDTFQELDYLFVTPVKVYNNNTKVDLFDNANPLVLLPQLFSDDPNSKIELTYTVSQDGSERTITIPMKGIKWEAGKSYTYTFTLDRPGLELDCEINPWTDVKENITAE